MSAHTDRPHYVSALFWLAMLVSALIGEFFPQLLGG